MIEGYYASCQPGHCTSLQDCKTVTGGVGFNVPIQITPSSTDGKRCAQLTCLTEDCGDAYQFPSDDTKTHTCPLSTDFDLTFCFGSSGSSTPVTKPAPTQASAPSPTLASAPSPTPASAPFPTLASAPSLTLASAPFPTLVPNPPSTFSDKNTSFSPEKTSSSSPEQSPSLMTGSVHSTDEKQQNIIQSEEQPVLDLATEVSYENLRKENGKTVPSSNPQQTTVMNQKVQKTDDATGGKNLAAVSNKDDYVQQISNRSADKSGGATFIFVGVVALCVVMVAAATIVVVRKKKAQLEGLESKTPQSTTAHGTLANFRTPRNNVSVL
ncbi:unnamed protein product [Peronospora destructor]|uniref:Uncharacterized protein n=1 Tax=Peronospora destructor TaxID=86335 RepID=A0AAV0UHM6_9STRA|nr:unnamed protein product [Peronospora destructor]